MEHTRAPRNTFTPVVSPGDNLDNIFPRPHYPRFSHLIPSSSASVCKRGELLAGRVSSLPCYRAVSKTTPSRPVTLPLSYPTRRCVLEMYGVLGGVEKVGLKRLAIVQFF